MTLKIPRARSAAAKCYTLFQANPDTMYPVDQLGELCSVEKQHIHNLVKPYARSGLFETGQDGVHKTYGLGSEFLADAGSDDDAVDDVNDDGEDEQKDQAEAQPFTCAVYSDGDLALQGAGYDGNTNVTLPKAQFAELLNYIQMFDGCQLKQHAKAGEVPA